jgi:hypothetical protein
VIRKQPQKMPSEVVQDQHPIEVKKSHKKAKKEKKSSKQKKSEETKESETPKSLPDQPTESPIEAQEPLDESENPKKKSRRGRRGGRGKSGTELEAPQDVLPPMDPETPDQPTDQDQKPKTKRGKRKRKTDHNEDQGQNGDVLDGEQVRNKDEFYSDQAALPELDPETRSYFENVETVIDEKKFETEEGILLFCPLDLNGILRTHMGSANEKKMGRTITIFECRVL